MYFEQPYYLLVVVQGTVLKKHSAAEESCYIELMGDLLSAAVPQFHR